MPRVVLLLPSSTYRAAAFLAAAAELGVDVVVASDVPMPTGLSGSDHLVVDVNDPAATTAAIVQFDATTPVDAVLGVDDRSVVAAAMAAATLGLPHAPPDAVRAARDKLVMRRRLDAGEVPQPDFLAVDPDDEAEILLAGTSIGYPCVVKPTTLSTSLGVIRADDATSLVAAARRTAAIDRNAGSEPGRPLLVERFVDGPEVAVEATLTGGDLQVIAVFDKPDPLDGPYFEETIYVTPSRLGERDQNAVTTTTAAACRALGLDHGPIHAELRVTGGRAQVIEIAPRTIGGLCGQTVAAATGRRLESVVLANALGLAVPPPGRRRAAGVLMVPAPQAGRLIAVQGVDAARGVPGVSSVEITVAPGRHVAPAPEGSRYVGFVFSSALTPAEAESSLRRAWAELRVQVAEL